MNINTNVVKTSAKGAVYGKITRATKMGNGDVGVVDIEFNNGEKMSTFYSNIGANMFRTKKFRLDFA